MKSAARIAAALLALAPALALAQRAPVPIALPHPPPVSNLTTGVLSSALLAISRAQLTNPQAAQNAAFAYVKALQQYNSGNAAGARESALQALAAASQVPAPATAPVPLPSALLAPGAVQLPATQGGLYGADAPQVDADTFLALARSTIDDCAARHDRALASAKQHYASAATAFAARNWEMTRSEAKAAIDACAKPRQ